MRKHLWFYVLLMGIVLSLAGCDGFGRTEPMVASITFEAEVAIDGSAFVDLPVGTTVTLPVPTKEHYVFRAWTIAGANTPVGATYVVTADVILIATWDPALYQVSFQDDDGTIHSVQSVAYLADAAAPADPVKDGFVFAGWDVALTDITGPLVVTARYTAALTDVTLSYSTDGGTFIEPLVALPGTVIAAPTDPLRTGSTFTGWFSDVACTIPFVFSTMPAVDTGLFSGWRLNAYTLVFSENGGSSVDDRLLVFGAPIADWPEPVREGSSFTGWFTDAECTNLTDLETMPAADVTLHAGWRINQYMIYFEENGGSRLENLILDYGDSLSDLAEPAREGYAFAGWYVDAEMTTALTLETMPANTMTLFADWTRLVLEYLTYAAAADDLNPFNGTDAAALYRYLTDALYRDDFDWEAAAAILSAEGYAIDGTMDFADWYAAGKHAAALPYARVPAMAAGLPQAVNPEGTVWRIDLRPDLVFEDGTPIDAATFVYSWRMLLDPTMQNANAVFLYDESYLPLLNAEAYATQNLHVTDELGFDIYRMGEILYSRANALWGHVTDHDDWPLYRIETGRYDGLLGPSGESAYVEYWGSDYASYGLQGFVIETVAGDPFNWDSAGNLIAPDAGWTLDGVAVPTSGSVDVTRGHGYAGAYPAYMDDAGNYAAVDADGDPIDGVALASVAVAWSDVGIKAIDDDTLELTLAVATDVWTMMGNLSQAATGVVHEARFEAGMNAARTVTSYGMSTNPLCSYGPYVLVSWLEEGYEFVKNDTYYDADAYRIDRIGVQIMTDQQAILVAFTAGKLDFAAPSAAFIQSYAEEALRTFTPATTLWRLDFNVSGSGNPILAQLAFRQAVYFAIDREVYTHIRYPTEPTQGFLGMAYLSTVDAPIAYRASAAGTGVLSDYRPDLLGYDPVRAKALFDQAYDALVASGDILVGSLVTVEFKYRDPFTSTNPNAWFKQQLEAIFNAGETSPVFCLEFVKVVSPDYEEDVLNGNFELILSAIQGMATDAPGFLGQVYNSAFSSMKSVGFNTAGASVTVALPHAKGALAQWIDDYLLMASPTEAETAAYDGWVALLARFDGDLLTCTYDELYHYAADELAFQPFYPGKADDFDAIAAAMETVLLEQMVAVPLAVSGTVTMYGDCVRLDLDEYHAWMGWGGIRYMTTTRVASGGPIE